MQQFPNNLRVSLDSGVSDVDTSFPLTTGDGAKLPTLSEANFLLFTMAAGFPGQEVAWEIIKATDITGDTLTVERAQEGSIGVAWGAGSSLNARATAGSFTAMQNRFKPVVITDSTARRILQVSDANKKIRMTNALEPIVFIDKDANVDLPIGAMVRIICKSASDLMSVTRDPAVTLDTIVGRRGASEQHVELILHKIAADHWIVEADSLGVWPPWYGIDVGTTPDTGLAGAGADLSGVVFDGTNLVTTGFGDDKIWVHDGVSTSITTSFATPSVNPGNLAITNEGDLLSIDTTLDDIFVHDGISSSILFTFAAPATSLKAVAFDGENCISADDITDKIYVHIGLSASISTSFAAPLNVQRGMAVIGRNLVTVDLVANQITVHDGISSAILNTFAGVSGPRDITYDGTNMISVDFDNNKIYIHDGVTVYGGTP